MISCTEFIPAYSELFTYLHENYGRSEVERFWEYLFEPDGKGIPLINYAQKDGVRGCWDYWSQTLTEEASDVTQWLNEEKGWMIIDMHYCPSKGRLLELEKEIGLKPYYDYCGHCEYYRAALEKAGLCYHCNHTNVDKAACQDFIYDPKVFSGMFVPDENTKKLEIRSQDTEYFHRDFHSSMNMGIDFVAKEHGEDALRDYLIMYTLDVYKPTLEAMKEDVLGAIEEKIRSTYKFEKSEDALTIKNDGNKLLVEVLYCPAVKHLKKTGREVSKWFSATTEVVMETLAKEGGIKFEMEFYDDETGKARYSFTK